MAELNRLAKIGGGGAATLILCLLAWRISNTNQPSREIDAPPPDPSATTPEAEREAQTLPERAPEDPFPNPPPELPPSLMSDLFPEDDPAWGWAEVDIQALRAEMPNNLAFKLAVPTDDRRVLDERQATRDRWKREYAEILRHTASEGEIRDYYTERQQVSRDYVEFTDVLIERYADTLNEQDLGLLQLAQTLHRVRLEEMPRRLTQSIERYAHQERLREAWLADEAAFSEAPPPEIGPESAARP